MATHTFYSIIAADNDANFRIWGKAISDGFQAVGGIVKLSAGDSSGQIDWTSVAKPAANTAAGYEMYRFDDTLQATYPVFIKVEYGSGAAGNNMQMWVTVGFAHNGSGTLTGFTSTRQSFITTNNFAVTVYATSHLAAASNRLAFLLRVNPTVVATNQPFSMSIERTHAADGSDTNYGVILLGSGGGGATWFNTLISFVSGVVIAETVNLSVLVPNVGHGSAGGTTAIYPCWAAAGPYLCPHGGFVFAFPGNITSGVPFTVTLLGSAKTFMPRTATSDSGLTGRNAIALVQCVRWD